MRARFAEIGLQPESRLGQNFLIDLNLLELLFRSAQIGPQDVVLEIGTGTASLTVLLAQAAAAVVTVEIDSHLHQLAQEHLAPYHNVTLLHHDALHNKNRFHAGVLEAVRAHLAAGPNRQFKLAANLPYNIATPVISNLLLSDPHPVTETVTIQKELAQRMAARPGTKDYSALSVWVQSLCDVEIIRFLPPEAFWPRPKVHSAIVHLAWNAEKRAQIADLPFFHQFVRSLFLHRRKFLRSVLLAAFKHRFDKPQVDAIMAERGLGPSSRAEELEVAEMLALCDACRRVLPAPEREP